MKKKNIIAVLVVAILLIAIGTTIFVLTRDKVKADDQVATMVCPSCGGTATQPTCTAEGSCEDCGEMLERLGHAWNSSTGQCTRTDCGVTCSHTGGTHPEGECTTCGYHYQEHGTPTGATPIDHAYRNETTHTPYYDCKFESCSVRVPGTPEPHEFDENGVCVCGATQTPAGCQHEITGWESDNTYHWKVCMEESCGVEISGTKAEHTVESWSDAGQGKHKGECKVCTYDIEEAHDHSMTTNCEYIRQCSKCNVLLGTHNYNIPATCTKPAQCDKCLATTGTPTDHDWISIDPVDPTCTTSGHSAGTVCNTCGHIGLSPTNIPALSHTGATHANGGTCTRTGCGVVYETHSQSTTIIRHDKTATGHTPIYGCTFTNCTGEYTGTEANHTFANGVCSVCSYVCTHPTTTDKSDETYHWEECNNCGEELNKEQHTYTDGECECGKEEENTTCEHNYQIDKVGATETGHWEKCTKCGDKRNTANHTFANGVCTVCDYICTHTNTTDKSDDTYHWEECNNCGKVINKEQHSYTDGECECGKTEENTTCEHNYQIDKVGATETGHWEKCTKCGDKRNTANHTFTNGVCTVCEYICTHKTTINKKDDTYHWKECNNCGQIINKEQHSYEDGKCECGKDEEVKECEHKNKEWKSNDTEHWQVCKDCGKEIDGTRERHSYKDGKCTDCGTNEKVTECEHKNKEWKSNDTEHWQVCKDCGKEIDGTREKHSYKDDKCTDCGTEDGTSKQDKIPDTGINTVVISTVVVAALAVFGIVGIKKYKEI